MNNVFKNSNENNVVSTNYGGVYNEIFRPQFHFSPESMWLNDPNGLVYYKGEYHMFYQHYPDDTVHGPMYWGHAVSRDLVRWENMPIALYPDNLGFIFSGNAIVDENNSSGLQTDDEKAIVAFFTHASDEGQSQSLAYSNDRGRTWTKFEGNPVIPNPGLKDFRDPFVFWNDAYGRYNMIVTMGDRLGIYSSSDLKKWVPESQFGNDEGSHGGVWECPALIELKVDGSQENKKWLLLVSVSNGAPAGGSGTQYFIGSFNGKTFINENDKAAVLWVDHGKDNYAGIVWNGLPEEDGRAICIGWMNNWTYANKIPTGVWRGSMTIPRELSLSDINGKTRLVQKPVSELETLRVNKNEWRDKYLDNSSFNLLDGIRGDTFELLAEFELNNNNAESFGFRLRKGGSGFVEIGYNTGCNEVYIDRTHYGAADFDVNFPGIHSVRINENNKNLKLQIFLDRSSIEVFINEGETVLTDQIFPDEAALDVELFVNQGITHLKQLDIFELKTIWDVNKPEKNNKMIACWQFDEDNGNITTDSISSYKDIINYIFNEAVYKPSTDPIRKDGIIGKALMFDGYSTWISRLPEMIQKPSGALTIEAWIAPCSFGQGDSDKLSAIVSQCSKEKRLGYILGISRYGKWSLQVGTGDKWFELWSGEKKLEVNTWSHIAGVFDGVNGKMAIYLNGQELAAVDVDRGSRIKPCNAEFLLGRNNDYEVLNEVFVVNMFHGLMDEVRIYKSALSKEDVRKSYMQYACGFDSCKAPMADVRQQRSQYNGDRHRPGYHFISPEHWMNEPHAPLYFKGMYHIFFQHNPKGPYFGNIHWGHAVSTDMVHWKDLPSALSPQWGQADPDGCWSGSSVIDDSGIPTLFYTAGDFGKMPNQMIAAARSTFAIDKDISLKGWVKQAQPVITQKECQGYYGEFRDPFVWKEGGTWYMLVGSGVPGCGGTALLYTSDDLVSWEYRKPVFVGNFDKYPKTGKVWELPVLLKLGIDMEGNDKHIFIINPCYLELSPYGSRYVFYWIGTWSTDKLEFVPDSEQPQMFDYGDHFTGPSCIVDEKGRNIIFSIAQDRRTEKQHHDSGWAHNAGLPLMLYLREDGKLGIEPVTELLTLREEKLAAFKNMKLNDANKLLGGVKGDMLELILEFDKCCAAKYGIALRCTPDRVEETLILFNEENSALYVDRTKSSLDSDVEKDIKGGPLDLGEENLKLHIFIDKSMIEVYANGLKSITTRAYPVSDAANGLKIMGSENTLVKNMEVWQLGSAYED